jgi:hypothetical protein
MNGPGEEVEMATAWRSCDAGLTADRQYPC